MDGYQDTEDAFEDMLNSGKVAELEDHNKIRGLFRYDIEDSYEHVRAMKIEKKLRKFILEYEKKLRGFSPTKKY